MRIARVQIILTVTKCPVKILVSFGMSSPVGFQTSSYILNLYFVMLMNKYTKLLTQLLGKALSLGIVVDDGKPVLLPWVLTNERERVEV